MPSLSRSLGAAVALSFTLPAQSTNPVVPALLSGVEGGTGSAIPFGLSGAARVQYIYDVEELPWQGPRLITRISLRADNSIDQSTAFPPKGFLFVTMLLSTTDVRAENASTVFADNYGTDAMVVLDNVPITLPDQPVWTGPRPANIDFVLQVPWFYGLTPARDQHSPIPTSLLVEIRVHSQPPGTYRLDNPGNCAIPPVTFGQVGPQCHPAGGPQVTLTANNSMSAGNSYTWTIDHTEPSALVILLIGLLPQANFLDDPTMPLPVPLFDPANPSLPPPALAARIPTITQSAPDCYLIVAPNYGVLMGTASPAGTMGMTLQVPALRSLVGTSVFTQVLAQSLTANPLQFVTSTGLQSTVCGPFGVARLYALGTDNAAAGQRSFGQGAVIEVR